MSVSDRSSALESVITRSVSSARRLRDKLTGLTATARLSTERAWPTTGPDGERAWPDAEKQRYADEHRGGWGEFLDRLATLLAKR